MMNFTDEINARIAADKGRREYRGIYVPEGDCLVYYRSDEPCHAVRLDSLVTVYVSDENDGRIVGCQIKDIRAMLEKFGVFGVQIRQEKTKLGYLLLVAGVRPEESRLASDLYNEVAESEVELCGAG